MSFFFRERLEGRVVLQHLGPPHRQFKIVRLQDGRRILVDQDAEVRDPYKLYVSWQVPTVLTPKHALMLVTA